MQACWYKGVPTAEAVAAHETLHKRQDGIVFKHPKLSISDESISPRDVAGDAQVFGNWIVNHVRSNIDPYLSMARLKVLEGNVYMALGFCQWLKMDTCRWIDDIECYPVGDDGLPVGFK